MSRESRCDALVPVTTASVSFFPTELDVSIEEEATGIIIMHLIMHLPELKKDEYYSYLLTAPGYERWRVHWWQMQVCA